MTEQSYSTQATQLNYSALSRELPPVFRVPFGSVTADARTKLLESQTWNNHHFFPSERTTMSAPSNSYYDKGSEELATETALMLKRMEPVSILTMEVFFLDG